MVFMIGKIYRQVMGIFRNGLRIKLKKRLSAREEDIQGLESLRYKSNLKVWVQAGGVWGAGKFFRGVLAAVESLSSLFPYLNVKQAKEGFSPRQFGYFLLFLLFVFGYGRWAIVSLSPKSRAPAVMFVSAEGVSSGGPEFLEDKGSRVLDPLLVQSTIESRLLMLTPTVTSTVAPANVTSVFVLFGTPTKFSPTVTVVIGQVRELLRCRDYLFLLLEFYLLNLLRL